MSVGNPLKDLKRFVFGSSPYSAILEGTQAYGFLYRGGLYILAIILSLGCMYLIPRRKMWFSYVGKYSMSVYILHVFVRDIMKYTGLFKEIKKLPEQYMYLAIPISIIAALVLGNPLFGKAINWISNPLKGIVNKGKRIYN